MIPLDDYVKRSAVVQFLKSLFESSGCMDHAAAYYNASEYIGSKAIIPSEDVAPVKRGVWKVSYSHLWEKNESGKADTNWWYEDYHNGVTCRKCRSNVCVHCSPDWASLSCGVPHYICSECGAEEEREYPFCHCGARMTSEHLVGHLGVPQHAPMNSHGSF